MKKKVSLTGYYKEDEELWLWDDVPGIELEFGYKVDALLHYEQSALQEISIADTKSFGRMLVLDGTPQYTTKDGFIYNEMITHIALATHPDPKMVAMIGGGSCGPAREVVKYGSVRQADVVEIDRRVTEVCRTWFTEAETNEQDPRIRLIHRDGLEWIQEQKGNYDVLLVDRSDPYGPAIALYKQPFYEAVYQSLTDEGIAVFQSGSPYYYPFILKDTFKNLRKLFPIVRTYLITVPSFPCGIWSLTIASKKWDPLQADLNRLQCQNTKYINPEIFHAAFVLPNYVKELLKG